MFDHVRTVTNPMAGLEPAIPILNEQMRPRTLTRGAQPMSYMADGSNGQFCQ